MIRRFLLAALLLATPVVAGFSPRFVLQMEPAVRIGLNQNASAATIRSSQPFAIQGVATRGARFSTIVSIDAAAPTAAMTRADLRQSMLVELDGGKLLVLPMSVKLRLEPVGSPFEIENRTYRGIIEVFGNSRNTFTIVNELPLEDYLLGVVPNELSPTTFGQLEALKAQAVAARTYIVRNLGQYRNEGYDICSTDACQVYFGQGTEAPLASQAVVDTRGVVATHNDRPIQAFYSSTCGGRTENAENIFNQKLPYLVSTMCEYRHPDPLRFSTSRVIPNWKDAVLEVAGVSSFSDAGRFLGLTGQSEPPSMEAQALAAFVRRTFYPDVKTADDVRFLTEQGILAPEAKEILFRLIDKKGAFEWQQGVLVSWDGQTMNLLVNGQPRAFKLRPDGPIFERIGDERIAMKEGSWIGGELMDFRAVGDTIEMLVFRLNFANPSADRYSRLAIWQTYKTKQELDTAIRPLNIGQLRDIRILQRGPSERPLATEVVGSQGRQTLRALRIRSLLGLRDSLFYFDIARNSRGDILGITFFGRGWGHGVGLCQVGAYGMALDGATYDQILKKYYTGIELKKLY